MASIVIEFQSDKLDADEIEERINNVLNHEREYGFNDQFDTITWTTTLERYNNVQP